ncbi:hypothetical protein H1R20_g9973, partial [Candolleomyces eurysporus]
MNWLTEIVPPPDTRVPLTFQSFTQLLLPSLLCYYATAVLVLIPGTFYARLAFLPVTVWTAFRTSTRLDLVVHLNDERLIYLNHGLALSMFTLAMRSVIWTFKLKPLYKTPHPDKERPPKESPYTVSQVALDAFDLASNLRGIGWNWSKGLVIPKETRPTHSRTSFVLATLLRSFIFVLIFDSLHFCVQSFGPSTIGSSGGHTIFDENLPPLQRYTRSTVISTCAGLAICFGIQIGYNFLTLGGYPAVSEPPFAMASDLRHAVVRYLACGFLGPEMAPSLPRLVRFVRE